MMQPTGLGKYMPLGIWVLLSVMVAALLPQAMPANGGIASARAVPLPDFGLAHPYVARQ